MTVSTRLTPARIAAIKASGLWRDQTLLDYLHDAVAANPDKIAVTAVEVASGRQRTCTYRQLDRLSNRVAAGLMAMGVQAGDVVSIQLPNSIAFIVLHLACLRCAAISNPLMPFLRHRELSFMLELAETKILIAPKRFRDFDYQPMIESLSAELPGLADYFLLGGEGDRSFEQRFLDRRWEDEHPSDRTLSPDSVIEILYTSGTTGEPKGVMHTSNTLLSGVPFFCRRLGLSPDDVALMASPLAHQTGFIYGMIVSIALGAKCVLQDIWKPDVAARLIQDEGVTYTMASTPFLSDLTEEAARDCWDFKTFRIFLSAGAPIPSSLVEAAGERLGAHVLSGWGMTENGLVTSTLPGDPAEKGIYTDGCAFESMELRVVDNDKRVLPRDTVGRLEVRGAGNFVGYLKRPEYNAFDADEWFDTGDLARMDADGYIRITGRLKDVIIRGGENIPVVEIENLLYRHPAIREVAIVGTPDARLGERACAFVTLRSGEALTLADMLGYLEQQKVTKHYFPERLEVLKEMPRTASGKIQKFRLREMVQTHASAIS
jgi:cyclohexanecarboxylate-CoA ligase